jgi:membrane-bound lytic murein transglycosylase B
MTETRWMARFATATAATLCMATANAVDTQRDDIKSFINKLVAQYQLDRADVEKTLQAAETKQAILDAISRPAEKTVPWFEYRERFMIDKRINKGRQFRNDHRAMLDSLAQQGAPVPIILGILGVETQYGEITGRYRVIDALSTLAFDYPPRKDFFLDELEQFFLMCREQKINALQPLGSYAGAMGSPQFMPHSIRQFGVDYNADGKVDLWNNWDDVLASVANYLLQHGWKPGEPVVADATLSNSDTSDFTIGDVTLNETVGSLKQKGVQFITTLPDSAPAVLLALRGKDGAIYRVGFNNFYVITRYNRSPLYANAVYDLGQAVTAQP